jgi:subtilisin family serine protease
MLKDVGAVDISPIRGLGRKGVSVVYSERSAGENEKIVKLLTSRSEVQYAAPLFSSNAETVAIIPEIVVRVKSGTDSVRVGALCDKAGCRIKKRMEFTEQEYLLEVLGADAEAVFAAVQHLSQAPDVEWACPNTAFRPRLSGQATLGGAVGDQKRRVASVGQDANTPGVFPNDEYFPMQWHLHNTGQSGGTPGADIRAPEAWEITTGDPNIIVAVPDTGVDTNHPDLADNLVPGYDFYENDDQPDPTLDQPVNTHGTACAGLIAAKGNNALGVTGVTWDCKIMPIKVETADGLSSDADIARAFRFMASNGADVITNSWGYGLAVPITHSAIIDVTRPGGLGRGGKGCVLTGASGNGGTNNLMYIARYPEVIAVGATNHNDVRCSYSSYGPELDITAPGGQGVDNLWTTDISGSAGWNMAFDPNILDYTSGGGTSFSSPIAAGVAALILSIEPNLTSGEVRHFLERSAKDLGNPGRDDYYGWGRVDAKAALDMVLAKRADLNNDWKVDLEDLLILIEFWGTAEPSADIAPAARRDGIVDVQDLELMMEHWQEQIPEPGPVARWKLDETEGSVAQNSVSDNDGILHGEPLWQPAGGRKAGALAFDGIDDYVSTDFVLNPLDGAFSVLAWIQGGAPADVVVSQTDGIGGSGETWLGTEPSSGKFMSGLVAPAVGRFIPQPLKSESVVTDGQWHHIGFVWDGAYRSLYVDGVEVAKDTEAQKPLKSATGGLYIGAGKTLEATSFFSGLIDDVRIYNAALKAEQIKALAN